MMIGKRKQSLETLIGQDSRISGEITSKGVMRIEGVVEGNIAAGFLVIGRTGKVKGDLSAREIEIDGTVEGNIAAVELVEIHSEGSVEGDIRTAKLVISDGAFFAGHSHMKRLRETAEEEIGPDEEKKVESIFQGKVTS